MSAKLIQLLADISRGDQRATRHIADVFASEFSVLNRTDDEVDEVEDFDGDDAYARDVCVPRRGPI